MVIHAVQLVAIRLQVKQGEVQGVQTLGPAPALVLSIYPDPQVLKHVAPSRKAIYGPVVSQALQLVDVSEHAMHKLKQRLHV